MFDVCQLCNGMISPCWLCPNCLNPTIDSGKREDYDGPYAPYQVEGRLTAVDKSTFDSQRSNVTVCMHIMYCEHCHSMTTVNGLQFDASS
ncbi:hypothetical protein [Paenibacillus taiwanensis]|uniref:hypothetical protein n=1 Tax=Paenibacillus taiwanensis TaxID=401638 RepID=UPI00055BA6EA|nr:hypothetical protein [Paenibacillus taiwanensis]